MCNDFATIFPTPQKFYGNTTFRAVNRRVLPIMSNDLPIMSNDLQRFLQRFFSPKVLRKNLFLQHKIGAFANYEQRLQRFPQHLYVIWGSIVICVD
jgi:hypothetical protein